ncbi:MAG: UDP-N-acetylglucosamine 1-carboxyvinyltransferase [Pseudomonadota bacterium]
MDRLLIRGGNRLRGVVDVSGAKNAALPQIAAALLSPYPVELTNLPAVRDVETMLTLASFHNAEVERTNAGAVITTKDLSQQETPYDTVRRMRATVLVLAPLLARCGHARVSLPGGCAIGARPVDMHMRALETLGAEIALERGAIVASAPNGLRGARIVLPGPSVGATAATMMAGTTARGETEILNAAREPEIADLAACLRAMGAQIEGEGTHRILVSGDTCWRPARHQCIPDRIEAGTYAVAAAITGGELELLNARLEHLASIVQVLESMGVDVWPSDRGMVVARRGALTGTDITTEPYPGFPTDLQAQFMALAACAEGASLIRETVFENRFMHLPELCRLGAEIKLQGPSALVRGKPELFGTSVMATDLRASVSLVLAGLVAEGETVVSRIYHLDRGYERLDDKLRRCGADIERLSE